MRKLVLGLVVGLITGLGTVAVAQTTTTSADFCVKDNGKLRLSIGGTCEEGEDLLTIAGEQGPPGADGVDGQNGADGQDGIDGTNGQDGADGTDGQDGVSGYEIVTEVASWGGGGGFRELTVTCPSGKRALGAGYNGGYFTAPAGSIDEAEINALPLETEPVAGGGGWNFVWVGDFTGPNRAYEHYVICADV